ncbi:pentapeptide repeat-containing protein [Planomonospora sp. ID82291]|uniref:pentapeptide repeat-containing protein n=1 Tax=Planomonospora sp. ID82291 TaxID=2738136 RepID=UPI0018C400D5|nr:pentapeptide repeat-containing protein [Planomonospora sp. ID82291]MBG0816146.1 pentapeptide repeat-containing protein [Planomonospora sp. ID82291]
MARRPRGRCLAHLDPGELDEVVRALRPGSAVDLRGTVVGGPLLERILTATGRRPGRARFDRAVFDAPAVFNDVVFLGDATFDRSVFHHLASFLGARFAGNASFREARFVRELSLHRAAVGGHAAFDRMTVGSDALLSSAGFRGTASFESADLQGFTTFDDTRFGGDAAFRGCRFGRAVSFRRTDFTGRAGFEAVRFAAAAYLTPAATRRRLALTDARAGARLVLSAEGCAVDLRRISVAGPLTVRLRNAHASVEGASLRGPATLTGRGSSRVTSLSGVDAASLHLDGVDLSACRLADVRRPEGLRLTGCTFARTPHGVQFAWRWPPLRWWAPRRALADEHAWRGWAHAGDGPPPTPHRLAVLYSRLRTAVDDRATAADFHFAALEMRRITSGPARRWLLGLAWALTGYGLRMGRAVVWSAVVTALVAAGLLASSASHAAHRAPVPAVRPSR